MISSARILVTGGAGPSVSHRRRVAAPRRRGDRRLRRLRRGDGRENLRSRAGRPVTSASSRATSATGALRRDGRRGIDLVFHQAAIRITQCAEEPRLALEVLVDGTFNVIEAAAEAGVAQGGRRLVGVRVRAGRRVPDRRAAPSRTRTDTFYGAAKAFNEGMLRSFHAMHGLDYVALRYFNVYGPRMDIHGVYTEVLVRWMERIAGGRAAADLRRRRADDGLRARRGHRAGKPAGRCSRRMTDEVFNVATRRRDQPLRAGRGAARGDGRDELALEHGPERAVNGVAPPAGRHVRGARAARLRAPRWSWTTGSRDLVDWWRAREARPRSRAGRCRVAP